MPDDAQFIAGRLAARYYKIEEGVVFVWRETFGRWEGSTLDFDYLKTTYNYEPIGRETAYDF